MRRVKGRKASHHRVRKKYLTRPEMLSIICYCEHMFWYDFVRRAQMLKSTAADVRSDVRVFIWQAIIKYRDKPYTDVLALGFVTTKNRLTSISRSNLNKSYRSVDIEPFLPFLRSTSADPAKQVEFLDKMHRAAYELVGMHRANHLLEATKFDWSLRNRKFITRKHLTLCRKLDMVPHEVYVNVLAIRDVMRKNFASKSEQITIKQDGLWTQR